MSKKLLSEAVVRRFAKLANLPVINEDWGSKKDEESKTNPGEEDYTTKKGDELKQDEPGGRGEKKGDKAFKNESLYEEDAEEEIADEVGMEDDSLPMPDQDELADIGGEEEEGAKMGMDLGSREELAMDVISAVADALNIEVDIEGGEGEEFDMGAGPEGEEFEGEELDMDAGAEGGEFEEEEEFEEEGPIMEALKGINYLPGKKEIVNEVAKRVAKRLLKAKQAQKQLKEALGGGPRKAPRKTAKPTATRQRTRSTRNSRRRTKK